MNRNPLIPIALVLISIGIYFLYISPTYNGSIATTQAQIAGYDSALTASAAYTTKENQLASERNAIPGDQLNRLGTFLPDSLDNVQMILDLDALAARSGLVLTNFSTTIPTPDSTQAKGNTSQVEIGVSATGSYAALQTFLLGIEHSLRLIDLISLGVKESDSGVYTYQMTFHLYSLQ